MIRRFVWSLCLILGLGLWAHEAFSQNLLLFSEGLDSRTVAQVLKDNPLGADQNIRATLLHKTERSSIHIVQIRDREEPHIHETHDLFVTLQRGRGILHIGGETVEMKKGDAVFIPQGTPHYFVNTDEEPAVALGVFTPPYAGKDSIPADMP